MKNSVAAVDTAIYLLRPNARYQLRGAEFEIWADPRPVPTWEEINDTIEKIKQFENSINTIKLEDYKQ